MTDERRRLELQAVDRDTLDRRWQDDKAWLELAGSRVPVRRRREGEGAMAGFEKRPMLWAVGVIALGGVVFLLVTRILI